MKTVLVTGGAGYIGSHTCKCLSRAGYNPVTFDNLSTGHKEFVKWGDLVIGDLHDTEKLAQTLETYKPVAVVHFAASAYVGESVENPFKYYYNNVGGSISLLDAMIRANVKNLVFSSTCATYGVPEKQVIDELTSQEPINPYGRSKLMVEQVLEDMTYRDQIRYIALRYFNAAGADSEGEIGEWHEPETHLIPLAIDSADNGSELKVFGNDFSTPDGTAIRDYIHVEDLAAAHLLSLEWLLEGGASNAINLGTGTGTSVLEILQILEKIGVMPKYSISSRRLGDPARLVASANKAFEILKWKPSFNQIEDILQSAVNWKNKNS